MDRNADMNRFTLEESPYNHGKYVIRFELEDLPFHTPVNTSYNVFIARLLGLTYANYMRYCRDTLGGTLVGKGHKYPTILLPYSTEVQLMVKLLNKRLNYILDERRAHGTFVREDDGIQFWEYEGEVFNDSQN